MRNEIYSRKTFDLVAACLALTVCGSILVSFFREYPKHVYGASGSVVVYGILGAAIILVPLSLILYAAIRVLKPTIVQGIISKTGDGFVIRQKDDFVARVDGKDYKFPVDSNIDAKLKHMEVNVIQVRMEVGVFGRIIRLEIL